MFDLFSFDLITDLITDKFVLNLSAVEIIASSSASLHEALERVSRLSGLSITRLKQIRKEFRENKRHQKE